MTTGEEKFVLTGDIRKRWKLADIVYKVYCNDCNESNMFLRAFYNSVNEKMSLAWQFSPSRDGKIIHIGWSTIGEMWIEYKERGKLNTVYIDTPNDRIHRLVADALDYAQNHFKEFNKYNVRVLFKNKRLRAMVKNSIRIESYGKEGIDYTSLTFQMNALGEFDARHIMYQKANTLCHLLCAYTNQLFSITEVELVTCDDDFYIENVWEEPSEDWIDDDELYRTIEGTEDEEIILSKEFFDLFRISLEHMGDNRKLQLILNSAQTLYCARLLTKKERTDASLAIPGITDLINTEAVSALEPLACIDEFKIEKCECCGNNVYSISKRIKKLCKKYLPEHLVKMICDEKYSERSKFLHEGFVYTYEVGIGKSMPIISPMDGRSMSFVAPFVNRNLQDYVGYVFRKKVKEVLQGFIDNKHDNTIELTSVNP